MHVCYKVGACLQLMEDEIKVLSFDNNNIQKYTIPYCVRFGWAMIQRRGLGWV